MIDGYRRKINYARISVTDRCNLRCVYCMPEDGVEAVEHSDILSYEQILKVCEALAALGMDKIKITGGEPLVRKDIAGLIARIKAIEGIRNVTMTTNGILLQEQAQSLRDAGLDAVNVSIDTLEPAAYTALTRVGKVEQALNGLDKALAVGIPSVKVNCVPMRGFNDKHLTTLAELARDRSIAVRFIELMPMGYGRKFLPMSEEEVRTCLTALGELIPYHQTLGNGPCQYYTAKGYLGKIGFISAVSHKFCASCNRIRLTSDGFLKTCLQYDLGADLRPLLEQSGSKQVLESAMREAIFHKPHSHSFEDIAQGKKIEQKSMSQIGG